MIPSLPEMTDLERRVLAHERVLQSLIAYMSRTEPRFLEHLKKRFVEPMAMVPHEHDHRNADDYAEEFIRVVMALGGTKLPKAASSKDVVNAMHHQEKSEANWHPYVSLGLWLIVSPFLLLGGEKSLMNARIGETAVLMLGGLVALWVACLNLPRQDLMQAMAGLTLGSSMIAAPLVLDLNESSVAVWNALVVGAVFVLSALFEFYDHWAGHNVQ